MSKKAVIPIVKMPTIENIPTILTVIEKGYKLLIEILGIGDKIGGSKPTNVDKCEISDLAQINNIFNEFVLSIEPKIDKIEQDILKEMYYYLDEVNEFFYDNRENLLKKNIRITKFTRSIERLKKEFDGNLRKQISKKISLDDIKCRQIIKMIPGDRKVDEMNKYFEMVLAESIETMVNNMHYKIDETIDDIEFNILDSIETLDGDINKQELILDKLESKENKNLEEKQIIREAAIVNILTSEIVLNILNLGVE